MSAIHLIERAGKIKPLNKGDPSVYVSGNWDVKQETAERLVGGQIYFHKYQNEPSFFGGTISGIEWVTDGRDTGRVVFIFSQQRECRGKTARDGWANEMKIVWDRAQEGV